MRASARGSFNDLLTAGRDHVANTLTRPNVLVAEVMDVVVAVPRSLQIRGEPNRGRRISESEIAAAGYSQHVPAGFVVHGWRAENVPNGEGIRIELIRQ